MVELQVFEQIVLVIFFGAVAARVGRHLRIPEILPLFIAGYILGSDVLGLLKPEVLQINFETLALLAIPVILFVDGLKADVVQLRSRWKTLFSVVTVAVAVTVFGLALLGVFGLGMNWTTAFLLGAILASTDPAAILPLIRKVRVGKKVSAVLEAETAFNDAMSITLFFIFLATATSTVSEDPLLQFLRLFLLSGAIGLLLGLLLNTVLRRVKIEKDLMLVSIVLLLTSYSIAEFLGASGIISAVVSAMVFGRYVRSHYVDSISRIYFFEAWDDISFFAVALIFLVLGSKLQVQALLPYLFIGVAIALAFMFLVRPLTILASMFFDKAYSFKEKIFISWIGGPRGAVSAALASIIVSKASSGLFPKEDALALFNITLVVIVVSVVLTSLTANQAAKKLLRFSRDPFEDEYRLLTTDVKTNMAAETVLKEDYKLGTISPRLYRGLSKELSEYSERLETKLSELSEQKPSYAAKEKDQEVERLITTKIDRLEYLYSRGEISEDAYRQLLAKNKDALNRLAESR
ncbi:MAG: cation:proton antiporter [Candidatus Micrarchaeia archaeon]